MIFGSSPRLEISPQRSIPRNTFPLLILAAAIRACRPLAVAHTMSARFINYNCAVKLMASLYRSIASSTAGLRIAARRVRC